MPEKETEKRYIIECHLPFAILDNLIYIPEIWLTEKPPGGHFTVFTGYCNDVLCFHATPTHLATIRPRLQLHAVYSIFINIF